ncbi:AP-5 complex subunit mu-1-like isoform X2 [Mercenaria mercenaria]|uniref:AP-5 complex subunit mu-1-like isoform X2 n=1 Tax=Mercenaria mercenaria TaxID=6596 RepID=UPI00234ECD42|nr:AP-5 complex subunit mu-1-like isoform X2 [Mercenaria mercenaria]
MSIQALWVVRNRSTSGNETGDSVLFSRFYQTFIRKSKQIDGDQFVPIPNNPELAKALLFELGHTADGFSKSRDSCQRVEQKPVYEVNTSNGKLWPLVVVEQPGLVLCCLPFVPQGASTRPPLIDIPGVTLGFTLLCALGDYIRNIVISEFDQKISDIYAFLTQAAPFGTVLDTTVDSVLAKMTNRISATPKTQKQPAWKPVLHKAKTQMHLAITEFVRAVQYDRGNIDDVWDVYGTVSCKAELEGAMPTVTMTISQTTEGEVTPLNHLIIHPCVQSADAYILEEGKERAIPRRVRFTPPLEKITLCHYKVNPTRQPPITGSFELFAEEDRVKIKVHLRLSENIKNAFEYCELQIPFGKRGPLTIQESSLNHGSLLLSPDKSVVVWNIGQRFPARQPEITVSAIILLGSSQAKCTGSLEEQFCIGQNAYAQLFFKIVDFTQSGCFIDAKSIQVSPTMKYKLSCVREFLSSEYKLWNVHGDSLVSAIPKCLSDHQAFIET